MNEDKIVEELKGIKDSIETVAWVLIIGFICMNVNSCVRNNISQKVSLDTTSLNYLKNK